MCNVHNTRKFFSVLPKEFKVLQDNDCKVLLFIAILAILFIRKKVDFCKSQVQDFM